MTVDDGAVPSAEQATVFVVDDDAGLRRAVARVIQSAGLAAETFGSADEFLRRLPYPGIGCVVLDVQMPGMSGVELQGLMASMDLDLPIVFLTAHGDVPTATQAMRKGATDFLQKPVDDEVLLATLRDSIERHRSQQVDRRRRQDATTRLERLSPRETEVLQFVVRGLLNKQIADCMGIALKTVKVHRAHVMEKLEVDSVAALVQLCVAAGMLDPRQDR